MGKKNDIFNNALASQLDDARAKIREANKLAVKKAHAEIEQAAEALAKSINHETILFEMAVNGARPLSKNAHTRLTPQPQKPKPIPHQFLRDERQALVDSLSDHYVPAHELETGEELLYLRTGHAPDILSKLRRGYWVIQAAIDLHGLISDEARLYVAEFLADCKKRGIRCVRIVHGKGLGSRNKEPVLKHKLRNWLIQKDEVIAYAQARKQDGGSGAVIVLLKA